MRLTVITLGINIVDLGAGSHIVPSYGYVTILEPISLASHFQGTHLCQYQYCVVGNWWQQSKHQVTCMRYRCFIEGETSGAGNVATTAFEGNIDTEWCSIESSLCCGGNARGQTR